MRSDRFQKSPLAFLLLGGGLLLLVLLLLLTWRGLQEESLPEPFASEAPIVRSTPRAVQEPSRSTAESPLSNLSTPLSTPPQEEVAPAPTETSEPVPFLPNAPVPAVFGATGNAILTNIPYAPGLEDIANDFIEKVKQGGWDTTSEAYKKNWEQAVEESDNLVRARYGTEVYLRLKQEAAP